jgi:hypothetical protein
MDRTWLPRSASDSKILKKETYGMTQIKTVQIDTLRYQEDRKAQKKVKWKDCESGTGSFSPTDPCKLQIILQ